MGRRVEVAWWCTLRVGLGPIAQMVRYLLASYQSLTRPGTPPPILIRRPLRISCPAVASQLPAVGWDAAWWWERSVQYWTAPRSASCREVVPRYWGQHHEMGMVPDAVSDATAACAERGDPKRGVWARGEHRDGQPELGVPDGESRCLDGPADSGG